MFHGTFDHAIDEKGRVNVPVKYREVLFQRGEERLFVTNFVSENARCLDVYPFKSWTEFVERLRAKPQFDRRIITFQNFYVASAQECQLDRQGRILIPSRLRDYAGLKRDVVFTGALDKFRIWDREVWAAVFEKGEKILIEDPSILNDLGI